ncbi:MAG: PKD domain-containing protein, partial [Chitinophagaceae bacterium]|nr:PKD domain-containing protein [Chitinophagaceae bacterium]
MLIVLHTEVFAQRPTFTINGTPAVHNSTVNVCQGVRLTFANTTPIFNIEAPRWRFQNGTPAASGGAYTIISRFDSVGSAKAVIITTDINTGRIDSSWVFLNVTNVYPVAAFDYNPATVECGSFDFRFNDQSTGNGLRYRWLFGDGRTSNLQNPTHRYDSAIGSTGTTNYTITQIVTNSGGCSDTATRNITVRNVPDIRFGSADPLVGFGPFNGVLTFRFCNNVPSYTFSFRNQSSTISTNTGYTIKWGDGTPDTSFSAWPATEIIRHTYPIGNHTMTVDVTGSNGCTNTRRYNVFIGSTPAGGFASPGNAELCAPDTLQFVISNTSNNPPGTVYTVTVNDGSPIKIFNHPAPSTVDHVFERSSCGITSSNGPNTFSNSFFALLDIE